MLVPANVASFIDQLTTLDLDETTPVLEVAIPSQKLLKRVCEFARISMKTWLLCVNTVAHSSLEVFAHRTLSERLTILFAKLVFISPKWNDDLDYVLLATFSLLFQRRKVALALAHSFMLVGLPCFHILIELTRHHF
jgi:hypothetical protein